MRSRSRSIEPESLEQAAVWRIRLSESPERYRQPFIAWLQADPGNDRAWRMVQGPWAFLGEQATSPSLIRLRRAALAHAHDALRGNWIRARLSRRPLRLAAAAVVVLATGLSALWWQHRPLVYRTGAGEQRSIRLADGSKISLDASTEVTVRYSADARTLQLVKGQARFDVAHDAERPFTVSADGHKVVATGTAFDVNLMGSELLVTLLKGHVVVLPQNASVRPFVPLAPPLRDHPVIADVAVTGVPPDWSRIALDPGEQLVMASNAPPRVTRVDVRRVTAWQRGEVVFKNETLAEVVERMDRYLPRPIVVAGRRAGELRISGVYQQGDVDGFVSTIVSYLPVQMHRRADGTLVLTYRSGQAPAQAEP